MNYKNEDVHSAYRSIKLCSVECMHNEDGYTPVLKLFEFEKLNDSAIDLIRRSLPTTYDNGLILIKDNSRSQAIYINESISSAVGNQEKQRILKVFNFKQFLITGIEVKEQVKSNVSVDFSLKRK